MARARTRYVVAAVAAAAALAASAGASAQSSAPDFDRRNIRPIFMLLTDTSGSMERLGQCECTSRSCRECLPQCSDSPGNNDERNRWATVLEALTGSFNGFHCDPRDRNDSSLAGEFDDDYFLPYHEPKWNSQANDGLLDANEDIFKFGLMTYDSIGTFTDTTPLVPRSIFQSRLGDNVSADGDYSYGDPKDFDFPACGTWHMIDNGARNENAPVGPLISVGESGDDPTVINEQIQNALADVRPFGQTPIAGMLDDLRFYFENHPDVQQSNDPYAQCRPRFALLLTDGFPNADMRGDPYNCDASQCTAPSPSSPGPCTCPYERAQFIAQDLCQQGADGECNGELDGLFVVGFNVGDQRAVDTLDGIAEMGGTDAPECFGTCETSSDCGPGFSCTAEEVCCSDNGEEHHAFFANNRSHVREVVQQALSTSSKPVTRARPAIANTSPSSEQQMQMQFNAGLQTSRSPGVPWQGTLQRKRFVCEGSEPANEGETDAGENDLFHRELNEQDQAQTADGFGPCSNGKRCMLTVVPENLDHLDDHIQGQDLGVQPIGGGGGPGGGGPGGGGPGGGPPPGAGPGGPSCGGRRSPNPGADPGFGRPEETGLQLQTFDSTNLRLTPEAFGLPPNAQEERDEIIAWTHGDCGMLGQPSCPQQIKQRDPEKCDPQSPQCAGRFADIFHSSPVLVGPPDEDIADESFNQFRRQPVVEQRPTVLYVGTNDGVLHAFAAEDADNVPNGDGGTISVEAGDELWGFVPPVLVPKLDAARTSHQLMVDGTPVVKNVFTKRAPNATPDGDIYRTILVLGLRKGARGYVALDVTNPFRPKFLWQFADPAMGHPMGEPALGQVLVEGSDGLQERAFALLPGGSGENLTEECENRTSGPIGCPAQGIGTPPDNQGTRNARQQQRCWSTRGRHLFFMDLATGHLLTHLDDQVFNAPLSGGAALFPGNVGQVANRAYLTDADGVLWRLDMSDPDMQNWDAQPLHDIFAGSCPTCGMPSFQAPTVGTDREGKPVVLVGTGDLERFDERGTKRNRIVSLTEDVTFDQNGELTNVEATVNWDLTLDEREHLTGAVELFNRRAIFTTFVGANSAGNACDTGFSRFWQVHFRDNEENNAGQPKPMLDHDDDRNTDDVQHVRREGILAGASVVQRPRCTEIVQTNTDPFVGPQRQQVQSSGGGQFEAVALVSGGSQSTADKVQDTSVDIAQPRSTSSINSFLGSVE